MMRARRAAVVCCTLGALVATPGAAAQAPPGKLAASLARLFGPHARRHAPRGQRRGAPDLHRGLAARLRPGGERHREGPADHVSRGDGPREPAAGRGHPGVPRTLRRRGGLRGLAQAVSRQACSGPAAGGPGHPEHLGRDDQRSRRHRRRAAHARRAHGLAGERGDPMSDAVAPLSWRVVPAPLRTLARWITIVQLVGYTTSLVYVWHTTRLTPPGIEARYRGANPDASTAAMQFSKSFAEMLTITHTHLLSMAVIFVLTGIGVALCGSLPERWRRLLVAEPFGALLVSFAAM